MWCLVMTTVWLLAAATTCARGGVPPAPMHARRPYDQPPQDLLRSESGAASVVADESWTNKRDTGSTLQASQLMLRSPRSSRQYDVPQIGATPAAADRLHALHRSIPLPRADTVCGGGNRERQANVPYACVYITTIHSIETLNRNHDNRT
ncbi:hypothetical protein CBL_07573 [Carabus blaptoides fortunei]